MSAAAVINGVPVNFGFQGAADGNNGQGIAITGISGTLLQSVDHAKMASLEVARDGNANTVMRAHTDLHDEATLEWIVTGDTLAHTLTNTAIPAPGSIIVITACASRPGLVGTNWEVQSGGRIIGSNTTAAKISVPIHKYPAITGPAS
jgi:hypothetical protein